MKNIEEVAHNGLLWLNVTKQSEKELNDVKKRFSFLEQDIKESLPPFQRAKIVKRPDYYFMVLHFPIFDRSTRRLGFTEIDFFLSGNYLVTIHNGRSHIIEDFFDTCRKQPDKLTKYFNGTAVQILFELLTRLLDGIFPILLHVNEDINLIDKKLFLRFPDREMAEEILRIKTNIVTFRRTMQGHRTVLERLIMYSGRDLDITSYQSYVNDLREFANEIWHMLESQKETINALHEANESLVGLRTNETMKILTIISVITFPLTLFATIFGIRAAGNFFYSMPGGFWAIIVLMFVGAAAMILAFQKKGWL